MTEKRFERLSPERKVSYLNKKFAEDHIWAEWERTTILYKDKKTSKWVACDNTDGCVWVEEFDTCLGAQLWLRGMEDDLF